MWWADRSAVSHAAPTNGFAGAVITLPAVDEDVPRLEADDELVRSDRRVRR
jgi:hypothetical protein